MKKNISSGTVHQVPDDMKKDIVSSPVVRLIWEDITPLARNEWICWIESAKKIETRKHRIEVMHSKLIHGKRRPCCWIGCPHR